MPTISHPHKSHLFNYTLQDQALAQRLMLDFVQQENWDWVDLQALMSHANWQHHVKRVTQNARNMMMIISGTALTDRKLVHAHKLAKANKLRTILLVVEPVDLPEDMRAHEWIDFRDNYPAALATLLKALDGEVIFQNTPFPSPGPAVDTPLP